MKQIAFIIINILCVNFLFGQSESKITDNYGNDIESIIQKQSKTSQVNIFLTEEWQGGLMKLNNNQVLTGYLYRYNIFTDQIELKSVVNPSSIEIISIGPKRFIYSKYFADEDYCTSGYFEVIENGNCKLLIRRAVKQNEEEDRASRYFGSSTKSSSTVIEEYYIKKNDEPAVFVEKNKESILKYLSDKKDFEKYLQNKIILFFNENRLIEIINQYNKL